MMAAGVMTFSSNFDALAKKQKNMPTPESFVEQAVKKNPSRAKEIREKTAFLLSSFPKELLSYLALAENQAREARQQPQLPLRATNFERRDIDPKYLLKIFSDKNGCFPEGTVSGNVSEVRYVDQVMRDTRQYGVSGRSAISGVESRSKDNILFFRIPHDPGSYPFREADDPTHARIFVAWFSHELAHLNAGDFDNRMTPEQRLDFFLEVSQAFPSSKIAGDPQSQDYIGEIRNEDQKKQYYLVVSEYWALLCERYLNQPEEFSSFATAEEKALIKKWLLKNKNEKFDPEVARYKRSCLTESMIEQQALKKEKMTQQKLPPAKKHLRKNFARKNR